MDGVHMLGQVLFVTQRQPPTKRTSHRHGDPHRALVAAGIDLARDGGPDAVILREATRRAGVAPNAANRHLTNRGRSVTAGDLPADRRPGAEFAAWSEAPSSRRPPATQDPP